jgi:hypothetical protein
VNNQYSEHPVQTHYIWCLQLTLPPNFVQKVDYDLALNYSHTVEVFSHRICKLLLALPSFLLPPSHGWRHFTNRRTRENKLVVRLIEGCRRIQSIVISVPVQDRSVKGGPLELAQCQIRVGHYSAGYLLTPGFASASAVFGFPTTALLGPAVTTSRNELPPVILPGTRRFLPLTAVELLAPTFSLVLEASDLESSGGGLDLGGAMPEDDIDRGSEEYILEEIRGFVAMGHLASSIGRRIVVVALSPAILGSDVTPIYLTSR